MEGDFLACFVSVLFGIQGVMFMSEKMEIITIQKCPKCAHTHTYQVFTRRTIVMFLADTDDEERVKTITCLFNCPSTGTPFQARLKIKIPANERITSVNVQPASKGD